MENRFMRTEDELLRDAMFVPCETEEELHNWVHFYLGLDLPNCTVDPESNSNPMALLWEMYSKAREGNDENFQRVLGYAARDSYKTILASIIEVLCLFHLRRSVAHMAAILPQAAKAQSYVKKYFQRKYLRDFLVSKNARLIEISYHIDHNTGIVLTDAEVAALPPDEQSKYTHYSDYITIVVATLSGANSEHVPFMCVAGDTKILIQNGDGSVRRKRVQRTARGIFNRLAGVGAGGNPSLVETHDLDLSTVQEDIRVLTLNLQTGEYEFKPIIRAHRQKKRVLRVQAGEHSLTCTPDHPLYVIGKGFVQAEKIAVGDRILSIGRSKTEGSVKPAVECGDDASNQHFSHDVDEWEQVVIGSILGDAGIYHRPGNSPYMMEQHSLEQAEYLAWKRRIINNKLRTVDLASPRSGFTGEQLVGYRTGCTPALLPYVRLRTDLEGLERLEALGLAVWYMDDGCAGNSFRLSTECFSDEQQDRIIKFLNAKFGLNVKPLEYYRDGKRYRCIAGGIDAKRRLVEICKPYIHPSMAYKFDLERNKANCHFCGEEFWFYEQGSAAKICGSAICNRLQSGALKESEVTEISDAGEEWVYDFTVADNHNFFSNGLLSKNCLDELDLCPRGPYDEAKYIPAPGRNGELPITFMTSSRKFSFGLVQEEIDKATETGLVVRHWNIIDVTRACPPSRHKPELPKIHLYVEEGNPKYMATEEEFQKLTTEQRNKLKKLEAYAGCKTCRLFPACKGNLATRQKSNSPLLKPIPHVINQFRASSVEKAAAQLMCWKPSSEGLVYPRLERDKHLIPAWKMAEKITGEKYPESFSKEDLIRLFQQRGMKFVAGMDHGFVDDFAVVTGALDGNKLWIFDVISVPGLELHERIELCDARIKHLNPTIYPDPAYPADIKTFRSKGYKMYDNFKKDVAAGIEAVRWKISGTTNGEPDIYFLQGDDGCEFLFQQLSRYHFIVDEATQRVTDKPQDGDDDAVDALRYLCQNLFNNKSKKPILRLEDPEPVVNQNQAYTYENWMTKKIQELTGGELVDEMSFKTVKKGSFVFSV